VNRERPPVTSVAKVPGPGQIVGPRHARPRAARGSGPAARAAALTGTAASAFMVSGQDEGTGPLIEQRNCCPSIRFALAAGLIPRDCQSAWEMQRSQRLTHRNPDTSLISREDSHNPAVSLYFFESGMRNAPVMLYYIAFFLSLHVVPPRNSPHPNNFETIDHSDGIVFGEGPRDPRSLPFSQPEASQDLPTE